MTAETPRFPPKFAPGFHRGRTEPREAGEPREDARASPEAPCPPPPQRRSAPLRGDRSAASSTRVTLRWSPGRAARGPPGEGRYLARGSPERPQAPGCARAAFLPVAAPGASPAASTRVLPQGRRPGHRPPGTAMLRARTHPPSPRAARSPPCPPGAPRTPPSPQMRRWGLASPRRAAPPPRPPLPPRGGRSAVRVARGPSGAEEAPGLPGPGSPWQRGCVSAPSRLLAGAGTWPDPVRVRHSSRRTRRRPARPRSPPRDGATCARGRPAPAWGGVKGEALTDGAPTPNPSPREDQGGWEGPGFRAKPPPPSERSWAGGAWRQRGHGCG